MENNMLINGAVPESQYGEKASRTVLLGTDTAELTKEFTLPDYIPDVRKVVSSGARIRSEETGRNDDRAGWDCTVIFEALLLCDDGTVREVSLQGNQSGEVKLDADASDLWLEFETDNPSMRATDPRKLTGRCRINVFAYGTEEVECGVDVTGKRASAEDSFEKKCETVGYTVIKHYKKDDIRASFDIELGSSEADINDIVSCKVNPYITSIRVNGTSAELTGEAGVEIIYSDADGVYRMHRASVPINAIIEDDFGNVTGAWASAETDEVKAAAQTNTYGEQKTVELDFSWNAMLLCALYEECGIVTDIYSTADEIELKRGTVRLNMRAFSFSDRFSVKGESSAEDLSLSKAVSIDAFTAYAKIERVSRKDGGEAEFAGCVYIRLICGTGDAEERCAAGELRIPFVYTRRIDGNDGNFEYRACADVCGARVKLENGRVTADADLCISAILWEPCSLDTVTGAEIKGAIEKKRSPFTLYYVGDEDTLWEVAKAFRVPADTILERNGITAEGFKGKKVIAIP